MKKNIFIILLLITAFSFLTGCSKNTEDPASEVPDNGQPSSAAPSVTATPGTSKSYYTVEKNGRQGVVNERGQVVLPFEYSKIDVLYCGETPAAFFAIPAIAKTGGQNSADYDILLFGLNGVLIYKGKCHYAIPYAYPICDGLIMLYGSEKCGVISYDGEEVIPFRYSSISLCGDYIVAAAGGFYSALGKTADVDIYGKDGSLKNSGKLSFVGADDSLIMVADDTGTKFGLVNTRFEEVVPAEWDELNSLRNGLYIARRGEKYGVIDSHGKKVISVKYDCPNCYYDWTDQHMYFSITAEDGAYIFDSSGKRLFFSDKFTSATIINGVIIAQDQYGSHYINPEGEDIIPPAQGIYADASGLIMCNNSEDWTCYTKEGDKLSLPEARHINIISPERFIFASKGNWLYGICGAYGSIIVPAKYTYMFSCGEKSDLAIFTTDKSEKAHYGVIDANDGSILLDGFDMLQYAGSGLFYVQKGSVHGLIDTSGSWIWQASDYQTLMD